MLSPDPDRHAETSSNEIDLDSAIVTSRTALESWELLIDAKVIEGEISASTGKSLKRGVRRYFEHICSENEYPLSAIRDPDSDFRLSKAAHTGIALKSHRFLDLIARDKGGAIEVETRRSLQAYLDWRRETKARSAFVNLSRSRPPHWERFTFDLLESSLDALGVTGQYRSHIRTTNRLHLKFVAERNSFNPFAEQRWADEYEAWSILRRTAARRETGTAIVLPKRLQRTLTYIATQVDGTSFEDFSWELEQEGLQGEELRQQISRVRLVQRQLFESGMSPFDPDAAPTPSKLKTFGIAERWLEGVESKQTRQSLHYHFGAFVDFLVEYFGATLDRRLNASVVQKLDEAAADYQSRRKLEFSAEEQQTLNYLLCFHSREVVPQYVAHLRTKRGNLGASETEQRRKFAKLLSAVRGFYKSMPLTHVMRPALTLQRVTL